MRAFPSLPLLRLAPGFSLAGPLLPSCSTSHSHRQGHTKACYFLRRATFTCTQLHTQNALLNCVQVYHVRFQKKTTSNKLEVSVSFSGRCIKKKKKHPECKSVLQGGFANRVSFSFALCYPAYGVVCLGSPQSRSARLSM